MPTPTLSLPLPHFLSLSILSNLPLPLFPTEESSSLSQSLQHFSSLHSHTHTLSLPLNPSLTPTEESSHPSSSLLSSLPLHPLLLLHTLPHLSSSLPLNPSPPPPRPPTLIPSLTFTLYSLPPYRGIFSSVHFSPPSLTPFLPPFLPH